MSLVSIDPSRARPRGRYGRTVIHCEECSYDLRGLPSGQPCPECGHQVAHSNRDAVGQYAAWSRRICIGLALLLLLTLHAVASVLVQPFEEIGGTAPALNLPGPKLWAMPLLQRPIGRSPERPGVIGTRTAMLSLLAVWLITAPCALPRVAQEQILRRLTRWTSVVLFGLAFGLLMGAQGLWPSELPPFRLLLVAGVELPAAVLLYHYLNRLCTHVPGRDRREAFARLVWLVPAVIFAGAVVLGVQWWYDGGGPTRRSVLPQAFVISASTLYGAFAVAVGVAATVTVGSLAVAFFHTGFPTLRRSWLGAHLLARGVQGWRRQLSEARLARYATALGAGLLVVVMMAGMDDILWIQSSGDVAGITPFVNFPGPKIWAAAIVTGTGYRGSWDPLLERWALFALNLAAVWLVSAQARPGLLRSSVRWLPVILIGAALGAIVASHNGRVFGLNFGGAWWGRLYAVIVVSCEIPTTLLLYLLLARLCRDFNRRALAGEFLALAVVIVILVGVSLITFRISLPGWTSQREQVRAALLLSAFYGASALVSAVWAVTCLARLSLAAVAHSDGAANSPPHAGG